MSRSHRRCRGRRDSPGTERCDWRRSRARGKPPQIHSPIASSVGAPAHININGLALCSYGSLNFEKVVKLHSSFWGITISNAFFSNTVSKIMNL
jgi:hypothetical protein